MLEALRGLASGGLALRMLLRELRGLRQDLQRIASALESSNAHQWPTILPATDTTPELEISFINEVYQAEIMEIELRLTQARGIPPTEEEILAEYTVRHGEGPV